jgi:hypothetical protein
MECLCCGGAGCGECSDSGLIKITDCPLKVVSDDVWEVIGYAELYEKGLPPVAGGALDQCRNFIDAANFIFQEKQYWKNRLGIID